jgi:pheromone shutdown protein TraB
MITERNIRIVGTSHVSEESKERIREAFSGFRPDVVCIELDANRFHALSNPQLRRGAPSVAQLGVTGFLFAVIGRALQKRMGDITGMNPGDEMLFAATLARRNGLRLEFIDQDASITLRNMSRKVRFSEKLRMLLDVFRAPFSRKLRMKIDIRRIPEEEVILKVLALMRGRYQGFYRVLIEDRNRFMAKRIYALMKEAPERRVMAVVGAGHAGGMQRHLKSLMESNVY